MNQDINDIFLAKWLSGELSQEHLDEFKNSPEYKDYLRIINAIDRAELPEYDAQKNLNAVFEKIKLKESKKLNKPNKIIKLIKPIAYTIAASVLLIFGYFYLFNTVTYNTLAGQSMELSLPDKSKVELLENSSLEYGKFLWNNSRILKFEGKASFDVVSGSDFVVNTPKGNIKVLGTSFSVNTQNEIFKVICFSGKVKVESSNGETAILTKGDSFQKDKDNKPVTSIVDITKNEWKNNISEFVNTDIITVINKLEKQYGFTINGKGKIKPAKFTGRFPHDNSYIALKTVFETMKIPYKKQGDTIQILNY